MSIIKCAICDVSSVTDETINKCPCCGWEFNSILVIADAKKVNELCNNVFKYSHSLFLDQIEYWKKDYALRSTALEAKVAELEADSVPFGVLKKNCKHRLYEFSCKINIDGIVLWSCTKQNCPIVGGG